MHQCLSQEDRDRVRGERRSASSTQRNAARRQATGMGRTVVCSPRAIIIAGRSRPSFVFVHTYSDDKMSSGLDCVKRHYATLIRTYFLKKTKKSLPDALFLLT